MDQSYLKHNENVIQKVPADRLLIWNLKDGWEPLCKFLGKPIPNIPIPKDNITGDAEFLQKMVENEKFYDTMLYHLKWNFAKMAFYGIFAGVGLYQYSTGRLNLATIRAFFGNHASKFGISL